MLHGRQNRFFRRRIPRIVGGGSLSQRHRTDGERPSGQHSQDDARNAFTEIFSQRHFETSINMIDSLFPHRQSHAIARNQEVSIIQACTKKRSNDGRNVRIAERVNRPNRYNRFVLNFDLALDVEFECTRC